MTVNSGINKEGNDIYGLAHYCEHMLFLGSTKFPQPTHFVDFVTQHGGKFNGFTQYDTTGFFFKVFTSKFEEAIEIFSRFFIDPLFTEEYVKKEIEIVNSEFEKNIQMDSIRKEMILRQIADKDSLFHRFSTGNTQTLWDYSQKNNINLRERTLEYYRKNYRPDNMKLIVYGNEDPEVYKNMVNKYFSEMKKREDPYNPIKIWSKPTPWEYNKVGKLVLYKTINNHHDLDISIMINDVFKSIPDNPSLYLKTLINYKGKGSLDDVLRKAGLVAGIKSHLRKTYDGFSLFKIKGYITQEGIKNPDRVISTIFKYINYIKEKALNKKLYSYVKKMYDLAFYYENKKKGVTKVLKSMCINIWKYDKKYLFSQHKILNEYNQGKIQDYISQINIRNAVILIGNKDFTAEHLKNYNKVVNLTNELLKSTDPFYHTNFSEFSLKEDFIKTFENSAMNNEKLNLFRHPKPLPKIVSLIKKCQNKKKVKYLIFY